jgi:hypothetical protein
MRCLKIPNTKHFHDITTIADAQALYARIKDQLKQVRACVRRRACVACFACVDMVALFGERVRGACLSCLNEWVCTLLERWYPVPARPPARLALIHQLNKPPTRPINQSTPTPPPHNLHRSSTTRRRRRSLRTRKVTCWTAARSRTWRGRGCSKALRAVTGRGEERRGEERGRRCGGAAGRVDLYLCLFLCVGRGVRRFAAASTAFFYCWRLFGWEGPCLT